MSVKGIVMSVDRKHAVLMLPGGEFRRVPLRGETVRIGQEWEVPAVKPGRSYSWLAVPALALAGFVAFEGFGMSSAEAAAIVSVDINPSINLAVSNSGRVMSASALDADGSTILKQMSVKGMTVSQAVQDLVNQADQDGFLTNKSTVVIGAVFKSGRQGWLGSVAKAADATLQKDKVQAPVVTVSGVSPALVKAMQKPTVSVGRYLLWHRESVSDRGHLTANQVKSMPIAELLNHPANPATSSGPTTASTPVSAKVSPSKVSSPTTEKSEPTLPNLPISVPSFAIQNPFSHHGHEDHKPPKHSDDHPPSSAASVSVSVPVPSLGSYVPEPPGDGHGNSHDHKDGQHRGDDGLAPSKLFGQGQHGDQHHGHQGDHKQNDGSSGDGQNVDGPDQTPPSSIVPSFSHSLSNPVNTVTSLLNNPPLL